MKSLYTGGSAIQKQDWATLGASAATIVGKGLIYAAKRGALQKTLGTDAVKKALPTPTAIVDFAALALLIVDFLNGFGTPNAGASLATASDKLDLFIKDLDPSCIPDPRDWSGSAATAYTTQVQTLKAYAATMKEYDKTLKGYLKNQADKISEAHMCITVNVAVLTAAAGIALALYMIPVVGVAVSQAWQIVAAFACCAAVFVVEMLTLSNSMSLSHSVQALAEKYVQLGKDVETKLAGNFDRIEGKVAAQSSSKLSGFRAVSDGLTDYTFAGAPTVSKLASVAGAKVSPEQKELLGASSDKAAAAKTPTDTRTDTASKTGEKTTPATPAAFTPPTLAQMGQASQGFGTLGQTFSQGVGQIQSLAQSAKGSAPPAPPVPAHEVGDVKDDDAKKDEDAEKDGAEAGAVTGKDGSERAPLDAAAPAGAAAGPAGRERVL
ncbi:hypothetical protein A5647_11290 [Mycobacterium sp. 1100029.7]|nr:hypothetical protein A5647_11290 [Mycobacterium sp. 1100029.7]